MPDPTFLFMLAVKMAATAVVVVAASLIAERVGALIGALVATLPIASGPAYILLALDHDARFIADSTVLSLAVHAPTGLFCAAYVLAAQRWPFAISTGIAIATWVGGVLAVRAVDWSLAGVLVLNAATYGPCLPLVQRFAHARVPAIKRHWFDIPLRAAMVAVLVGAVVMAGANVGPRLAGILAVFPIVLLSLMLILHQRIGGQATAAVIANSMWGLIGFGLCILALHLAVVPLGAPAALVVALLVSVIANSTIFLLLRLRHGRARAASEKAS
jgi:uncharacterized membrane protein (GlpM family)